MACAHDKDRVKWLFLWSIGGRSYKISSEWRSLFTGRRPTRDSVVRLSFSRALSLSAANRRSLVPSLSPSDSSLSLSLKQASRSGKRKGKRKKERKKERRTRIVATRESRVCSQCARRVRSVFTGLLVPSCLVSTRLATPSPLTSPHLALPLLASFTSSRTLVLHRHSALCLTLSRFALLPLLVFLRFFSPRNLTASPHLISRLVSLRLASSRLASPHLVLARALPRIASPRLASPRLSSPRLTSSRLASPRLDSTRLDSARLSRLLFPCLCFSWQRASLRRSHCAAFAAFVPNHGNVPIICSFRKFFVPLWYVLYYTTRIYIHRTGACVYVLWRVTSAKRSEKRYV